MSQRAGVRGFPTLVAGPNAEGVCGAVTRGYALPEQILGILEAWLRPCSTRLSNRECEVVALVAEGYSNKEIAEVLKIHLVTVGNHRASAIRKLQLSSSATSTGLVRYAVRNKLVEA